jgi:hypothetical protein
MVLFGIRAIERLGTPKRVGVRVKATVVQETVSHSDVAFAVDCKITAKKIGDRYGVENIW